MSQFRKPLVITIACLLAFLFLATPEALSADRRKGPYLIYPDDTTSMDVHWQLDGTDTCILEWGTDTTYSLGQTMTSEYGSDHQHTFTITGLGAGTKYYYRVTMGSTYYPGSFYGGLSSDATRLKFLAYGDTRTYPSYHNNVAAAMISTITQDPEYQTLAVVVGDLVYDGRDEADWDNQFFIAAYSSIQELLANIPYHSAVGNHELSGSGNYYTFKKYFPYPHVADHYWSYDYGPAHFVMVDQYVSYTPGSPQLTWIENDLAASDKPWKFIHLHEPGWSAGGHSNEVPVQLYLQPLCEKYNVQIIFGGHNHYYARAVVDGVQHITTGGGGAPLTNPDPSYPYIVATSKSRHYCKIAIDGNNLFFSAVKPNGTVIDSFSLVLPLWTEETTLPGNTGGTVDFALSAGLDNGGDNYLMAGSLSGTDPGTLLPGGLAVIPLNRDWFTDCILARLNSPTFTRFWGTLNVLGVMPPRNSMLRPCPAGSGGGCILPMPTQQPGITPRTRWPWTSFLSPVFTVPSNCRLPVA